ncbi:MAG: DUF3106 domain-containing protein [Rhodoferax sp.]|nr:DUF3106 domain-containing protein [Rhodoferax sp.]
MTESLSTLALALVALGLLVPAPGVLAQTGTSSPASAEVVAAPLPLPPPQIPASSAPFPQNPVSLASAAPVARPVGPLWLDLTKAQQETLRPLAPIWSSLSANHKNKWIALAQTYPSKTPTEQEKMQSRMVEWAALKPSQRELARLNFAETKKLAPPKKRTADWEAYQALSPQEKRRFATREPGKPAGAAVAISPVLQRRITPVPITRHTVGETSVPRPQLDRNTLLPLSISSRASQPSQAK